MDAETRDLIHRIRLVAEAYRNAAEEEERLKGWGTEDQIGMEKQADLLDEAADAIERIYAAGFEAAKEMAAQEAEGIYANSPTWHGVPVHREIASRIRSLTPQEPSDA